MFFKCCASPNSHALTIISDLIVQPINQSLQLKDLSLSLSLSFQAVPKLQAINMKVSQMQIAMALVAMATVDARRIGDSNVNDVRELVSHLIAQAFSALRLQDAFAHT